MSITNALTLIPISDLVESKTNPRKTFNPQKEKDLAGNIGARGIDQPLLVRPYPGKKDFYEIVDGARRFRAAKAAKLEKLPCVIHNYLDDEVLMVQIISFDQKDDIHPLDRAAAYGELEKKKFTIAGIAAKVGKDPAEVAKVLRLNALIEPAKKAFRADRFTLGHAILLCRLQPKDQEYALEFALKTWQGYAGEFEYDNSLNPDKQEEPEFAEFETRTVCSVKDLEIFIQKRILLDLHEVAFDTKDAQLVPAAGSCIACPKRTGANEELFNDITKKDICTDPGCFALKQQKHLENLKAELKKGKKKFVELTADYRKPIGHEKAFTERNFKKVTGKPCKHARIGIYIDEANKGKDIIVCIAKKECKQHWAEYQKERRSRGVSSPVPPKNMTPAQKAKAEKEQRERKIQEKIDEMMKDELLRQIPGKVTDKFTQKDLAALYEIWDDNNYGDVSPLALLGIRERRFAKLSEKQLTMALKLTIVIDEYDRDSIGGGLSDSLINHAQALGINVKEMEKGIRKAVEMEYDAEAKAKIEADDPAKVAKPKAGVCYFCGCTENKPCSVNGDPCAWADKTKTLCDNPKCLEAMRELNGDKKPEKKTKKSRGKKS